MVFITAGMGGGTGTGAAPVIAQAVRDQGILTVGVVTKPFAFEGDRRMRIAEKGIAELQQYVHTLIVIPNQNLFRVANDHTTVAQAFAKADEVLHAGVRGITDLIVMPGMINLDFADIRSVIAEMGKAMMGTGEAEGEDRAIKAADLAISNPLLDDVSMKGARGVLINITGGPDLTLFEVEQAANRVRAEVDPDANIIFGNTLLDDMEGRVRVSVVATGIDAGGAQMPENVEPLRPHMRAAQRGGGASPEPPRHDPRPAAMAPRIQNAAVQPAAVNPVRRQVEVLADEMTAAPKPPVAAEVAPPVVAPPPRTVGEETSPARSEYIRIMPEHSLRQNRESQPVQQMVPPPERHSWGGLFGGRKKPNEVRQAPAPMQRPATPRQPQPARPQAQAEQMRLAPQTEDLFPDHSHDDKFEIPAFLRRQTN